MRVAVIDAGGANFGSVCYALERLGAQTQVVRDADGLRDAARVLLPGVGAAGPAMRLLRERGFADVLPRLSEPLLGICLGMQLLFESSEEGDVACLGLLQGRVRKLAGGPGLRVPHMGWNTLETQALKHEAGASLLDGIGAEDRAYFVHSYAAPVTADCLAACTHGEPFAALVARGRVAGAQFHPERSSFTGARLLANFLQWNPT